MDAISNAIGQQLHWVQPMTFERHFELRAEDHLLGSLRFETAFGTLATAELAPGWRWGASTNLLRNDIEVRGHSEKLYKRLRLALRG